MELDIELRDLTVRFPTPNGSGILTVYDSFDLEVECGSFTVLVGPSGCGKSSLLNVVDGLLKPTRAGAVRVLNEDIRKNPGVTRKTAYVFQSPRLLKWKTLRDNVIFGMRGLRTQPRERWDDVIEKYFRVVGLQDYMTYYPHQVSGGMQQRASIVRAWVNEPRILLMDEPFSHLDEISAGQLRDELVKLWTMEEPRRTIVFVTHDLREAVQLGDRIVMLSSPPVRIVHEERIKLDYPREEDDEQFFNLVKKLRGIFFSRQGV